MNLICTKSIIRIRVLPPFFKFLTLSFQLLLSSFFLSMMWLCLNGHIIRIARKKKNENEQNGTLSEYEIKIKISMTWTAVILKFD